MTRRRARRALGALLIVVGLLGVVRVSWVAVGAPPGERTVPAQVAFLAGTLDGDAPQDMQALFPEGEMFLHVLTGLAAVETDPDLARAQLAVADSREVTARFGAPEGTAHGIFHAGWTLLLAARIAERTGEPSDLAVVDERAPLVLQALLDSPTGVPASYPNGYWPCDAVVAGAAVASAAALGDHDDWIEQLRGWRTTLTGMLDPGLELLPHRVDATGRTVDGPRGSSQSIIQTFWPMLTTALDGGPDLATWLAFRDAFVVSVAGLVGVREYPVGTDGPSDVDSGGLVAGVSLSASAVTLAAARAVGDTALADDLDREAELLGLPLQLGQERRYALGVLPVGDAFLAFARAEPVVAQGSVDAGPRVGWVLLALPPALLALLGVLLVRRRRPER